MKTTQALLAAGLVVATFGIAIAKLPAPPMTDAQKAAAEEAKAKAAATAAVTAQQLTTVEDRVASRYFADMKAKGKQAAAPQMAASASQAPATPAKDAKAAVKK